jgi:hypothetical protein
MKLQFKHQQIMPVSGHVFVLELVINISLVY